MFENPKNDKYALLTEFYYSSIGRKVESSNPSIFTRNIAKYNYLHLPIMFRMRFKFDSFDWYVILGPQVSYWLGGKGTYDILDGSRDVVNSYDYKINFGEPINDFGYMNMSDVNRFQLGLSLGLGWYYELNDADRIAAGETVTEIADPYVSRYAELLEQNPNAVGVDNDLIQRAMKQTGPDGKPAAMDLYAFEKEVRKDNRWQYTKNAKDEVANVTTELLRSFGVMS